MMYSALQLGLVALVGQVLALPNSGAAALAARNNCPEFDGHILSPNFDCTEHPTLPCYYCCDSVDADIINGLSAEPFDECHTHPGMDPNPCGGATTPIHCHEH